MAKSRSLVNGPRFAVASLLGLLANLDTGDRKVWDEACGHDRKSECLSCPA